MQKLTDKQERFIQELLKGKTQREAYRIAYPKSKKWKEKNVDSQASKLFKTPKVFTRYNELKSDIGKEHKEKLLFTKEEATNKLKWLADMAEEDLKSNGFRQANSTAFLNAIKELMELEGLKAETNIKIEKTKTDINKVNAEIDKLQGTDKDEDENTIQDFLDASKPNNDDIEGLYG